jgi:TPR repeat protein
MRRRWIVTVPLGLLVVGWLHYARHGVAAVANHLAEEESAEGRIVSALPLPDVTASPVDVAPTASAVRSIASTPAPAPLVPAGAAPVSSGPAASQDEEPTATDVQAGINAVANVDYDGAAAKFERACSHGSAFACGALGKLLATGTGLPKNVTRGRVFLTRGCTSAETWACNHLAAIDSATNPSR